MFPSIVEAAILFLCFCSSGGQSNEVNLTSSPAPDENGVVSHFLVNLTSSPAPDENGVVSHCSSTAQLQERDSTLLTCSWPLGDRDFPAQLVLMMQMASQPKTITVTNREGLKEYCIAKEPIQSTSDRHSVDLLINKTCYENKFGSEALTITCQENGINSNSITYQGEFCIGGSIVPTPATMMTPVLLDSSHTTATATSLTSESISVRPTPTQSSPPASDPTSSLTPAGISAIVVAAVVILLILMGLYIAAISFCIHIYVKRKTSEDHSNNRSSSNGAHVAAPKSTVQMQSFHQLQQSSSIETQPVPSSDTPSEINPPTSIEAQFLGQDQMVLAQLETSNNSLNATPSAPDAPSQQNSPLSSGLVAMEQHPESLRPGFVDSGVGTLPSGHSPRYGQEESGSRIANEQAEYVQRSSSADVIS